MTVVDIGEVRRHIRPKADSSLRNMRKDDLIEYIRCLEHNYNVAVSFNENQAKYIESLDTMRVAHERWIPFSERLPEWNTEVLIARKKERHEIGIGYFDKQVGWYDLCDDHFVDDVIAWMPLPELYREEE